MKIPIVIRSLLMTAIAFIGLIPGAPLTAQTFRTLHHLTGDDGATPYAGLVVSGGRLYGTAYSGGNSGNGTLFVLNTDGTGFTALHHFSIASGSFPSATNSDGIFPNGLVLSGNTLYGTAQGGGVSAHGTVFALNIDGTDFTNLHSFTAVTSGTNRDGRYPRARVLLTNDILYGAAEHGGNFGNGTVFRVNVDGAAFTNLHSFTPNQLGPPYTNADGARPFAGLALSSNTLYGTTLEGGLLGGGAVFAVGTDGTGFRNLYSFESAPYPNYVNGSGAVPYAGLIALGCTLFGTTFYGGSAGSGTVFKLNTDGEDFTSLHVFTAPVSNTNSDGTRPYADLVPAGDTLFGAAQGGGSAGSGTLFSVKTNGTGFTTLYHFTGLASGTNNDGAYPVGLALSGYSLYGMANSGGHFGKGTVFSLSFAPQLTIVMSDMSVVLTWPTTNLGFDYDGFTLQTTTNLASSIAWASVSPAPVVVNGKYTVTNSISDTHRYYRLAR